MVLFLYPPLLVRFGAGDVGVGACSFSLTIRSTASASVGSGGSSRGSAVRIRSSLRRSPRHRCRRGLTRSGRSSSRRRRGGARRADNLTIPHELVQGSLKILGKLGCASLAKFVANHLCVGRNESRWRGLMAFRQVSRRGRPAKVANAIERTNIVSFGRRRRRLGRFGIAGIVYLCICARVAGDTIAGMTVANALERSKYTVRGKRKLRDALTFCV